MNPFLFGNPVEGEYYLEQPELRNTVLHFLNNGINVVLIGPRRFGKTSFILEVLRHLEKDTKRCCVLVDIFNITSHRDFLRQLVNALRNKQSLITRFGAWVKALPKAYAPLFSWENDKVSLQFRPHLASDEEIKQLILETLDALHSIAADLCIAFDEFQSIARIEDGGWLEASLRTKMQEHKNVSFLFSGSRRSLIHDMFNNPSRPFYRSCQLIDFPAPAHEFTEWVIKRFRTVDIVCSQAEIEELRALVHNTPNYVQMVCFHIAASGCTEVTPAVIHETLVRIIRQNAYAYQTLLNSLTSVQQRVLRLAACERESVFAKENLVQYEIKTGAHVSQAIHALKDKEILDEDTQKGRVIFDDPLFALWLQLEYKGYIIPASYQQTALFL